MGLEVIRVAVAARLVVGEHDLWSLLFDHLDQLRGRFSHVGGPKSPRPVVFGPASHARIGVTQAHEPAHTQAARRRVELAVAQLGDAPCREVRGVANLAEIAAGTRDDDGPHTFGAVAGKRTARGDGLIVGVGVDRQQGFGHRTLR